MAETDVVDPGDNPLLAALHAYKKGVSSPPVTVNSGAVNPFSDLAVKKKIHSGNVSAPTASPAENGGANDLSSNPLPETPQVHQLQQQANTASLNDNRLPQNTDTFTSTDKAQQPTPQEQRKAYFDDQNSPYYQDLTKQREDYEKQHPGDWANALPHLEHALVGMVTKPVAGASHIVSDIGVPGVGEFAKGLDAYNNETAKDEFNNPLPHTFLGNTAEAAIHLAPLLGAAKFFPEGAVGEDASALSQLKSITINPFTKISAIQGGLDAYDQARQKGLSPGQATIEAAKGFGKEGAQAAVYNVLGEIGGGYVAPKISDGLVKSGLVSGGKLTKIGVDAATDATIFSAYPIASNLIQGKPVDWDEVEGGAGIGLLFGGMKGVKTAEDFSHSDKDLQDFKENKQAVAMQNFLGASPDAIKQAYELKDNPADITANAIDYAAKAKQETDLDKRKQFIAASSTMGKAADVKSMTQAILANRDGFVVEVQKSDMPDEQKQAIIQKINETYDQLNPTDRQKQQLGSKISSIDADLQKLQPIANAETDPVKKTETEVAIENLTKVKDEAYKQLKGVISGQHEEAKLDAAMPGIKDLAGRIANGEEPTSQEDLQLQANYPKEIENELKNIKENNDAVSEQSTGKVGVREPSEVGEGMGKQNEPVEPAAESQPAEVETNTGKETEQLKPTDNESNQSNSSQNDEKTGQQEANGDKENNDVREKGNVKAKIVDNDLIQPTKLKGSDYYLALAKFPNGDHAIIDTNSGMVISKPYEDAASARLAYSKSREKLTPKLIEDAKAKLEMDDSPQSKVATLSPDAKAKVDAAIEPHGITYDQIKDYEKSRGTGLPANDGQEPASVQEDLQQSGNDTGANTNENPVSEGLREEHPVEENTSKEQSLRRNLKVREKPMTLDEASKVKPGDVVYLKTAKGNRRATVKDITIDKYSNGDVAGYRFNISDNEDKYTPSHEKFHPLDDKSAQLEAKLSEAKAELSKSVKRARSKTSIGVDPELLKSMAKVIKAYAELGVHKFSEIVKDWVKTYKDTTDEDVDALKGAYAAHVANLEPAERKPYDDLKTLDKFMEDRKMPSNVPAYTPRNEPRLPIPTEEGADAPELKKQYSKLSALKSYGVRNLEQLKAFAKDIKNFDAYREVRRYATSKSQSSVILKTATKGITDLVGKEGWEKMRQALVESRLRGIRNRWNSYADEAAQMTDSQVKDAFKDGQDGNMYDLVKNLQPLEGEDNPAKFAVSLIASGRYDARNYLSDVYKQAADNVLSLGIPFDEIVKDGEFVDPKMQQALKVYKDLIETPIKESHASNEGIFSNDLGDLDTYYPLTGQNSDDVRTASKGKPFKEPSNIDNRFATGQSDNYSTEVEDLSKKLTASIKNNNKANALDALKKVGLITDVAHNSPETQKMQVGGDVWDFVKEKVADSRTLIQDGSIINTPSKYVMMPKWLKGELDPIFNSTDEFDKYSAFGKFFNVLTKVALGGPTEAIAHSYRMLGVLTNSVPFMQEWAYKNGVVGDAGGYVANNPFVKKWTGLFKILGTDISSDKALKTIQEMSKLGIIPEKTWTKTWSREFAELNGSHASRIKIGKLDVPNLTDFSPILYGKHSVDLKARVLMYNLVKAMNPDATPEQHVKMQNELGVYTKALQGTLERKVKESGLAPYYTFGSSVYRTALKSVLGLNPLQVKGGQFARYKAAQLITNGVVGSVGAWMLTYHAQTGKWPWEDESSKLGRLPFPDEWKNDFTAKFFTDANGDYKDINMMAVNNPIVERGMRVLGAEKAYETNQLGGSTGQSVESGATQAANTLVSPFTSSPALQFATTLLGGSAPYVTGLRDDRGKPSPQLFKKVKAVGFGMQPLANAYSALKEVNPLVDAAVNKSNQYTGMEKSIFGLNSVTNPDTQNEGASSLGYVLNMAFPRFFVPHGNDDAKAHFLEKGQKDLEKTIEKEQKKEDE